MKKISEKLYIWYNKNNFLFPWRQNNNSYDIWISEIMLQQTQVNTVISYYNKWMKQLPSIEKVARADIEIILKLWEGLGYYKRAHNIHESAKTIVEKHDAKIPNNYIDLIELKGIGDYTASAILSIAYDQKYPAIDSNLKRVIARLAGISNSKKLISQSKDFVARLMHNYKPGDINQSLMDLGREICLPNNPKCYICPISQHCIANKNNKVSLYTHQKPKKIIPTFNISVGIIWNNNKILISKRKKGGVLGGLWELPGGKEELNENSITCLYREINEEIGVKIKNPDQIGKIKHQFSHFKINLTGYHCFYHSGNAKAQSSEAVKWIFPKQIIDYAFPKATLKLFTLAGLIND